MVTFLGAKYQKILAKGELRKTSPTQCSLGYCSKMLAQNCFFGLRMLLPNILFHSRVSSDAGSRISQTKLWFEMLIQQCLGYLTRFCKPGIGFEASIFQNILPDFVPPICRFCAELSFLRFWTKAAACHYVFLCCDFYPPLQPYAFVDVVWKNSLPFHRPALGMQSRGRSALLFVLLFVLHFCKEKGWSYGTL